MHKQWHCSQLLTGGRTAHSTFKTLLKIHDTEANMCSIKCGSAVASLLQEYALIVWDESTMIDHLVVEALDRTLKDVCKKDRLMGDISLLFPGGLRQILPVVSFDIRDNKIHTCLKSYCSLKLITNMKCHLSR